MITVKFPFDIKYVDSMQEEAIVVNLTEQGGSIFERQCADIAFMLLTKESVKNILVYNPEKADSYKLMEILRKKKDEYNLQIRIEEIINYEV